MNKNQKTLAWVLMLAVGMVGVSFAAVPLYRLFCQVTGWDGTPMILSDPPAAGDARNQFVMVRFNTDTHPDLPWDFNTTTKTMRVQVGVQTLIHFKATSQSNAPTTGTAVYNVTPEKAAKYFHKTQCFCFGEQTLPPRGTADFPVSFYIDPAFTTDPEMQDVGSLVLSYTYYSATSDALDRAMEAYYDAQ